MTTAPIPSSGADSRRRSVYSLQTAGGDLHSTGEGVPGSRNRHYGAGGKLRNSDSSLCRVEFNPR